MFQGRYSYHQTIRRALLAFGTLFNGIQIKRSDAAGNTLQTIAVPLTYGPKQKFIQRNEDAATLDTGRATFENVLPHIGYEMTGLTFDAARKLATLQQLRHPNVNGSATTAYVAVPYNLGVQLAAWAKNQDDAYQMVEQILPYFNPDFVVPVLEVPELNVRRELQIVLDSVSFEDDYTGNSDQRLAIVWTFNFTMKINLYGYVGQQNLIREAIAHVYSDTSPTTTDGLEITVTPDPVTATPGEEFGFNVGINSLSSGT